MAMTDGSTGGRSNGNQRTRAAAAIEAATAASPQGVDRKRTQSPGRTFDAFEITFG
jgi:hypothetical protein